MVVTGAGVVGDGVVVTGVVVAAVVRVVPVVAGGAVVATAEVPGGASGPVPPWAVVGAWVWMEMGGTSIVQPAARTPRRTRRASPTWRKRSFIKVMSGAGGRETINISQATRDAGGEGKPPDRDF